MSILGKSLVRIAFLGTLVACAVSTSEPASADVTASGGIWEGTGVAHPMGGGPSSAFSVTLTRKSTAPGKVRTDGKVTLQQGQIIDFWEETEDGANGFKVTSSKGSGGGRCFANGMCSIYEAGPDGHGFATSMAKDADGKLRLLITELDKGQPVRFMEQTLVKKP